MIGLPTPVVGSAGPSACGVNESPCRPTTRVWQPARVATVLDRYGHLLPDCDTELRERLEQMLAAANDHSAPGGQVIALHNAWRRESYPAAPGTAAGGCRRRPWAILDSNQ